MLNVLTDTWIPEGWEWNETVWRGIQRGMANNSADVILPSQITPIQSKLLT